MFLHPFGLLALLAVPAVVGLHLFRRRFQPRVVSAVFLWDTLDRAAVAGRKREPLHRSASFWCELFAALLLGLAVAGPRGCGVGEAQHLVVVLDASASMAATIEGESAIDRARQKIEDRLEALPRGSRATLIASGHRPRILAGPAAFTEALLSALNDFEASTGRHDLEPAIAMGAQLAAEGRLMLVTDHFEPDKVPANVELVAVGAPAGNIAIATATRRTRADGADGEEVLITLQNFDVQRRELEVLLSIAGAAAEAVAVDQRVILRKRASIEAGSRTPLRFALPKSCPPIELSLRSLNGTALDALALDDRAYLVASPPRTLAIASTLPRELALHLGLTSTLDEEAGVSNIDRLLELIPRSIEAGDPAGAHLIFSEAPTGSTTSWCLSIEPPSEDSERRYLIGPFLIDRRHPLMEGLTLEGIVWSSTESQLSGVPIVSAGDLPLLTEEEDQNRRIIRMHYEPRSSSLHRSPDWPILLANLTEARRRELPGPDRTSFALGEAMNYRDRRAATYELSGPAHDPQATRVMEARGVLTIDDFSRPGIWSLSRQAVGDAGQKQLLTELAASFVDAAESDLRDLSEGVREASIGSASVLDEFTWLEMVLLAGGLALVLLDFAVLRGSGIRPAATSAQAQEAGVTI
ncbi:MAG: hypothetical protein ACI835_002619 [Planctomycetota bacterium]